jgi:hypothetical protein
MCRAEYEYQVDFFNLSPRNIFDCKAPPSLQQLREEPGVRTYPNSLQHGLDAFKAPLSILSVIAVAVSQMWFVSSASDRRYKSSFLEDLDVMAYVINILGSPAPDYFKGLKRPSVLPALPDRPSSSTSSPRLRRWPSLPILRRTATESGLPDFSSSPPPGYREKSVVDLFNMESDQTPEEEGLLDPSGGHERGDDSESSGGEGSSGRMGRSDPGREESQSDGQRSSTATSSLPSGSVDTFGDSQTDEVELDAATSSLHLASKAKDAALYSDSIEPEDQEPNESFSAEQSDMQSGGASWHQEWQSLDDEQDLVLKTAALALVEDLQASSQTGVKTTDNAAAASSLFDFLVNEAPLQEVASKLHWIEERREVMLEQWEEVLQEPETRRWLEEQQGLMQ